MQKEIATHFHPVIQFPAARPFKAPYLAIPVTQEMPGTKLSPPAELQYRACQ